MSVIQFDQLSVYRQHIASSLADGGRHIAWFDQDFAQTGVQELNNVEAISRVLAASGQARVQLLMCEEGWFWRHCPRLIALLHRYGHAMEVRVCAEADRRPGEQFLLTDTSVVRRFHPDSARGASSDDVQEMAACRHRFNEMWLRAQPSGEGHILRI